MRALPLSIFALAFMALCFSAPARAADTSLAPAGQFIQKMGDKALLMLTDKDIARSTREARTRQILRENFDVPTIARFALGTYWNQATDAEKKQYMSLFEDMIVKTYATRFEEYSGQSFKVDSATDSGERDSLVNSRILQKDGPPVSVQWRVRKKDGGMKVVDVVVENISMSVTQRSDFSAVIQSGGGKVAALLKSMQTRKDLAAAPKTE